MSEEPESQAFLNDFRWIMDVVQNVDVGLVLLDKDYKVHLWNSFMQNHSATAAEEVIGHSLFDLFRKLTKSGFAAKYNQFMC